MTRAGAVLSAALAAIAVAGVVAWRSNGEREYEFYTAYYACPGGFEVPYTATDDPSINAAPPGDDCLYIDDFDVRYEEYVGAAGADIGVAGDPLYIREYRGGELVGEYLAAGEPEDPPVCHGERPLADQRIAAVDGDPLALPPETLTLVGERPCPSDRWRDVARIGALSSAGAEGVVEDDEASG